MKVIQAMQEERGMVSLLTCILISLLLVTITLSVISLETVQLRKSEDAEQSLRAYYVAEAGVEDAAAKILDGVITGNQACQKGNSALFNPTGSSDWTCQQVSFTGSPTGDLGKPDEATTVDPTTAVANQYHSVLLEWQQSTDPILGDYTLGGGFPACGGASICKSYSAAAPPLELSIVQYPTGGFAAGDPALTLENVVFVPGGNTVSTASLTANYALPSFTNSGPVTAYCGKLGTVTLPASLGGTSINYNCYAVISNLDLSDTNSYLFRIRSRYTSSTYKMVFMSGVDGGATVNVPNGSALIDVTAKAGTEYRRVISELPLGVGAAAGLNYVIYSDTNVCKDFDVINNGAQLPYPC